MGFQVLVQNGHWSDNLMSSIAMVTVKVYNKTIIISREHHGKITVSLRNDPLSFHHILYLIPNVIPLMSD